ncbi:MAG: hypothetical protein O7D30_04140, partial [Rickettsia endosymbiont of Ixodes persulcatus]|nr:hypothetical protein [Rickettsia endosymbiont of Ixodes persulcatus]
QHVLRPSVRYMRLAPFLEIQEKGLAATGGLRAACLRSMVHAKNGFEAMHEGRSGTMVTRIALLALPRACLSLSGAYDRGRCSELFQNNYNNKFSTT